MNDFLYLLISLFGSYFVVYIIFLGLSRTSFNPFLGLQKLVLKSKPAQVKTFHFVSMLFLILLCYFLLETYNFGYYIYGLLIGVGLALIDAVFKNPGNVAK